MTTHPHPMSTSEQRSPAAPAKPTPRWLWPALIGIPLVGALLVFGVISPSILLYAGLIGGCALMHVFGHGGHGGQGHSEHGSAPAENESLSGRSSGAQASKSGSAAGLDRRAPHDPITSETQRHDQHSSHGCH